MNPFEKLPEALRLLRHRAGLKQYELADRAGITKPMLSAYETGAKRPATDTLSKVLAALGEDVTGLGQALRTVQLASERMELAEGDGTSAAGESHDRLEARQALAEIGDAFERFMRSMDRLVDRADGAG